MHILIRLVLCLALTPLMMGEGRAFADAEYRVVARRGAGWRAGGVDAELGETVELGVARRTGRGRFAPLPEGARVEWSRVVPLRAHRDSTPPNAGDPVYSNTVHGGPEHGRWIGPDTIEYEERPLQTSSTLTVEGNTLTLRAIPSLPPGERTSRPGSEGAGSMWLAATVHLPDGRLIRTPGAESVDRLGLRESVTRVSFRTSNDFLGWMSTLFDVPFVFGSTPTQVDRSTGVDCADAMVAGWRRAGHRGVRYTSVSNIATYAHAITDVLYLDAEGVVRDESGEAVSLRYGEELRRGDMVAIDYTMAPQLARPWDHIGALAADSGPGGEANGVLDGEDLLRHMGRRGLVDQPLRQQGVIRLRLWRWRR